MIADKYTQDNVERFYKLDVTYERPIDACCDNIEIKAGAAHGQPGLVNMDQICADSGKCGCFNDQSSSLTQHKTTTNVVDCNGNLGGDTSRSYTYQNQWNPTDPSNFATSEHCAQGYSALNLHQQGFYDHMEPNSLMPAPDRAVDTTIYQSGQHSALACHKTHDSGGNYHDLESRDSAKSIRNHQPSSRQSAAGFSVGAQYGAESCVATINGSNQGQLGEHLGQFSDVGMTANETDGHRGVDIGTDQGNHSHAYHMKPCYSPFASELPNDRRSAGSGNNQLVAATNWPFAPRSRSELESFESSEHLAAQYQSHNAGILAQQQPVQKQLISMDNYHQASMNGSGANGSPPEALQQHHRPATDRVPLNQPHPHLERHCVDGPDYIQQQQQPTTSQVGHQSGGTYMMLDQPVAPHQFGAVTHAQTNAVISYNQTAANNLHSITY